MQPEIVQGDLLDQPVEAIVNPWNRNVIPWWLLLPSGVSGRIKERAGTGPFRELARHGSMPLGSAVVTGAGRLGFRGIIHVAGINLLWRATESSLRDSVRNALAAARARGFASVAIPLVGAGSGGMEAERALRILLSALEPEREPPRVIVVRWPGVARGR